MKKIIPLFLLLFLLLPASISSASKMDSALSAKIKTATSLEKISAIVYMKEKADLAILPKEANARMSFLEQFSQSSQKDIADFLEQEKRKGKVESFNKFWIFNGFALTADKNVIYEISKRADVERIELNKSIKLPPEPKELVVAMVTIQASTTVEANIAQIKADQVWAYYNIKGNGVKIGIADTGCLATHTDIKDRILLSATFNDLGIKISDTATDLIGHGTHVAGIVAGGNASGKYIGVAPEANLLIARVFDDSGNSAYAQVAGGVQWLISNEAKVVNLSLGAGSGEADSFWEARVDEWNAAGVVIVGAIGNYYVASSTTSPANVPNAVGVGAVDSTDTIANFSSRGPIIWDSTSYTKPDICAPGSSIQSAWNNGAYSTQSGTSMAGPHVAGVIALMLEASPTLDAASIKTILTNTTYKKTGVTYPNNDYGWGRVDAFSAVTAIVTDEIAPTIEAPTVTGGKYGEDISISVVVTDNITGRPSVYLYFKNDSNVWETVSCTAEYGSSTYTGLISASKVISNIRYYIKASDIKGNTSYSPAGAPGDFYTITISPKDTLSISDNNTCPNPFSPGSGNMALSYYLSKPCDIILRVFNIGGEAIKTFSSSGTLGYNSFSWDGVLDTGEIAGNGVYLYQISARDATGGVTTAKGKIIILR